MFAGLTDWIHEYSAVKHAFHHEASNTSTVLLLHMLPHPDYRTRTVSHVGSDGSTMAQRIAGAGFTTFPQAENVAGRQQSALEVSAGWMCSQVGMGSRPAACGVLCLAAA